MSTTKNATWKRKSATEKTRIVSPFRLWYNVKKGGINCENHYRKRSKIHRARNISAM